MVSPLLWSPSFPISCDNFLSQDLMLGHGLSSKFAQFFIESIRSADVTMREMILYGILKFNLYDMLHFDILKGKKCDWLTGRIFCCGMGLVNRSPLYKMRPNVFHKIEKKGGYIFYWKIRGVI